MIREWKDSTLKRFIQEGRGVGEGKDYRGWLQIQDVKSRGRSTVSPKSNNAYKSMTPPCKMKVTFIEEVFFFDNRKT